MDVNLNLYKYFLSVIEEQSVSKAAVKLGVSQPTVSYNLHALQRELGQTLFVVEQSGAVPVKRAMVLYRRLKPVYVSMLDIIHDFMDECKK